MLNQCSNPNLISWDAVICFAFTWQTIIASLFALLSAWWTIKHLRSQIELQENQYNDEKRRTEWSARASLPGALSEFSTYCSDAMLYALNEQSDVPTVPFIPLEKILMAIKDIETNASNRAFELVSHFQVQHARLASRRDMSTETYLYDITLTQAYINSLFDYGRNETEIGPTEPPTKDEMNTAYNNAVGLDSVLDNDLESVRLLRKTIDRCH